MNMKPVTTIFDPKKVINKNLEINNVTSQICIPRRIPRKCLYQEDRYESFTSKDSVKDFTCLNKSFPPLRILLERIKPCLIFYKLENKNNISIPEVTDCIRIDSESYFQSLFKEALVPLPQWFHHGRDCRLSLKRMLKIFLGFLQSRNDLYSSVLEEWNKHRFLKTEFIQQLSYSRHYDLDTHQYSHSKCY